MIFPRTIEVLKNRMRIQTAVRCRKDDFIYYFIYAKMERQITSIMTKENAARSLYFYLCSYKKNNGRFAKYFLVCQKHSVFESPQCL